jgi:hypothetical protein
MIRHLKNTNELVLYASLSCGAAYLGRLLPPFYFPILLLRLGIFAYCIYVIGNLEKNREFAVILGGAVFIGMIGGYWDYIELLIKFDSPKVIASLSGALFLALVIAAIVYQVNSGGQISKK